MHVAIAIATLKDILAAFNAHDLLEFHNGKIVKKDSYWKIIEK